MKDTEKKWLQFPHFLKICDGKIIYWDYDNHQQFEVSIEHLLRLIDFSKGTSPTQTAVDEEIIESGVLVDAPSYNKWGWDWLSHIFHYGTRHPQGVEKYDDEKKSEEYALSYMEFCASIRESTPEVEIVKGGARTTLPSPDLAILKNISLWTSLSQRRTCRDFDGRSVSLDKIATLLFCAFGDIGSPDPTINNLAVYGYRRTAPAAGGLQCTEPYLWASNIEGLPPGIYHYLSQKHELEFVRTLPEDPIGAYLCNQNWANDMAFSIVMTSRFDKMWWKYPHSRAYRPMLMEVGHFSQTLNLAITAMGLKPWLTGYFHDRELAEVLGCTPDIEHPIFLVGGGSGSGSSIDKVTRKIIQSRL